MAKRAKLEIVWMPSPTSDVVKLEIITTIGGITVTAELSPADTRFEITVEALQSFAVQLKVTDSEGLIAFSETYTRTLGDLEAPLPPTNISHNILLIEDVPEPPPTPPGPNP